MQETKLNKLSQNHIDELDLRGTSFIDIPATDSAGGLLTLWSKNMIVQQTSVEYKIIGILLLARGPLIVNKYMEQKIFDEEVSVLGNFLTNKTSEETDIILSGTLIVSLCNLTHRTVKKIGISELKDSKNWHFFWINMTYMIWPKWIKTLSIHISTKRMGPHRELISFSRTV